MIIFWVVAPCSLIEVSDVSEMLPTSIGALTMEAAEHLKRR
jgi:hypothetical protein